MRRFQGILLCIILLASLLPIGSLQANTSINYVITPQYDYAISFGSQNTALVVQGNYYSVIDRQGKVLHRHYQKYSYMGSTGEGLAAVRVNERVNGFSTYTIGYIDMATGNEAITPQFDWSPSFNRLEIPIQSFSEGLAAVRKGEHWGFIDKSGKEMIRFQYDNARYFAEGLAPVQKNEKWGFIDKTGKQIIGFQFDDAYYFSEGLAQVLVGDQWGYIDRSGKMIIKPQFKHSVFYVGANWFSEGLAWVEMEKDKWAVIDKSGKVVVNPKYQLTTAFLDKHKPLTASTIQFREGLAAVPHGEKWGFIDTKGREVIKPQFDFVKHFKEGLAPVRKNGKWGYINQKGELVVGYHFDDVLHFNGGLAAVKVGEFWGYIANPLNTPSSWAKAEVEAAIALQLVPAELQHGYTHNITRADFSKLAVNLLQVKTGKSIEALLAESGQTINRQAFKDTQDSYVLAAFALGIVTGKGNGNFDPHGDITRQEAAIMLSRTAQALGLDVDKHMGNTFSFADQGEIASWATRGVAFVASTVDSTNNANIMGGTGDNKFSPKAKYSKQQAYITIKRLYFAK